MAMRVSMSTATVLLIGLLFNIGAFAAAGPAAAHPGKRLAFAADKGNCLACHAMPTLADAEQPGNSGPPLIAMQARFPGKAELRARIWDASAIQPDTFMPLFGKHKLLTEHEIDQILDFIYSL
jgi:L-cysteine S-thiosulfotransferase